VPGFPEMQPQAPHRRLVAFAAAAFVFGATVVAALTRSTDDFFLVFRDAPRHIVPEGHREQVRIVEQTVPAGSTIFFLTDSPEDWRAGLWERSLYPRYTVVRIAGGAERLPDNREVRYAISAGAPPPDPGFECQTPLPPYPNGLPSILGRLRRK
jgi:hypothetical protein